MTAAMLEELAVKKSKPIDLSEIIKKNVMSQLDKPKGLHQVNARHVYSARSGMRWRVDIYCEIADNSFRITHSYFVITSEDGSIISSEPQIQPV